MHQLHPALQQPYSPVAPVHGHHQHRGVVIEDLLCALAVVHVPVQDQDLGGAGRLGGAGCNGHVVEIAVALGAVPCGVVACGRGQGCRCWCMFGRRGQGYGVRHGTGGCGLVWLGLGLGYTV